MIELNGDMISTILKTYNLGNIKSIKKIKTGHVNYDFDSKTNKGDFIIQIIGDKFNKWKKDRLKIQFELLTFLKNKKFPYECPNPLKNKYGRYLLRLNKHHIWIYKKIEGKFYKHYNLNHFKEIAKSLATYHNYIKNFKCHDEDFFNNDWLFEKYSEMKKIESNNKLDTLMLDNIDLFENILEKISETDFMKSKFVLTHSDFSNENLIFEKDRLKGIIDFDNLQMAPVEKDIAIAVKRCNYLAKGFNKKKLDVFLKEYRKYSLLSIDERLIFLSLIKDNCSLFWWFYSGMKKSNEKERYNALLETVKETKKLIKFVR